MPVTVEVEAGIRAQLERQTVHAEMRCEHVSLQYANYSTHRPCRIHDPVRMAAPPLESSDAPCALAATCAPAAAPSVTDRARESATTRRFGEGHALGVRIAAALVALGALAAGTVLAAHHPTQPRIALATFVLWCAAAVRWPRLWLFVLPASLPAANFAPWTGWLAFAEFDLVVMGALAAGFAALARPLHVAGPPEAAASNGATSLRLLVPALLCVAAASLALVRGFTAGGDASISWYDGYTSALNALRVGKSLLCALLLVPLLHHEFRRSPDDPMRRVAAGMLMGTGIVVAAIVWERLAYVGLFDFTQPYRTTALFWEMHVGGAAIDGYLALAWPFAAAAVLRSRTPSRWAASALLVLLVGYACLTTFSRGLYLAVFGGLVMLFAAQARRPDRPALPGWRPRADWVLAVVLFSLAAGVVGSESFMRTRLKDSGDDLAKRLVHWRNAVGLLHSPTDWWLGRGSGRLPVEYAASVPQDELPGSAQAISDSAGGHLSLSGPAHDGALAGRYALTQRVPIEPIAYSVDFDVRVDAPVLLGFSVCTMHLLHEGACQRAVAQALPGATPWQRITLPLAGPRLPEGPWRPRTAVFAITVLNANARVELDNLSLAGGGIGNVLHNADFSQGLAYWFPAAKNYFVPWHVDNFYLELLVEQGVAGLTAVALLLGSALATGLSARQRGAAAAPTLAACLVSALLVGTVDSLLDVPRVAFLLFFLAFLSILLGTMRGDSGPLR